VDEDEEQGLLTLLGHHQTINKGVAEPSQGHQLIVDTVCVYTQNVYTGYVVHSCFTVCITM